MKVYNVNIYLIDHEFFPGELQHKGHALVKVNMFGAREIATNKRLRICEKNNYEKNVNYHSYEEDGYVLGVEKSELVSKHLATPSEVDNYLKKFNNSELKKYFEEIKLLTKEEMKEVKEKIKKYQSL